MIRRAALLLLLIAWTASCGGEDPAGTETFALSGHAFSFGPDGPGGRVVSGAKVTVRGFPEIRTTTREDGSFTVTGLPAGAEVALVLTHPDRPEIQTGTLLVDRDLERITFQSPTRSIFSLMAKMAKMVPDPERCQIASTVTRRGNSLYDAVPGTHGEPGATVTIDPPLPPERGPIYFNLASYDVIFPDPSLAETTDDGGVLFLNAPPGAYTLEAHKAGTTFLPVRVECRAGVLTNASPPWGLQAIEGGVGPRCGPAPNDLCDASPDR